MCSDSVDSCRGDYPAKREAYGKAGADLRRLDGFSALPHGGASLTRRRHRRRRKQGRAVIPGGGLGLDNGVYRAALATSLRGLVWLEETREISLLDAVLGEHAGVVAAACAALDRTRVGTA